MTAKMFELKTLLKESAVGLRNKKSQIKDEQRKNNPAASFHQSSILSDRRTHRHYHIAYCLLRGTPYELIEKPAENNPADMDFIERIKNEYSVQDVRVGQA